MPVPLLDVGVLLPELDDGHQGEGYGDCCAQQQAAAFCFSVRLYSRWLIAAIMHVAAQRCALSGLVLRVRLRFLVCQRALAICKRKTQSASHRRASARIGGLGFASLLTGSALITATGRFAQRQHLPQLRAQRARAAVRSHSGLLLQ